MVAAAGAGVLKIIRPNSSDPIAAPRSPRSSQQTGKVIGRLVALLVVAVLLLGFSWLR